MSLSVLLRGRQEGQRQRGAMSQGMQEASRIWESGEGLSPRASSRAQPYWNLDGRPADLQICEAINPCCCESLGLWQSVLAAVRDESRGGCALPSPHCQEQHLQWGLTADLLNKQRCACNHSSKVAPSSGIALSKGTSFKNIGASVKPLSQEAAPAHIPINSTRLAFSPSSCLIIRGHHYFASVIVKMASHGSDVHFCSSWVSLSCFSCLLTICFPF